MLAITYKEELKTIIDKLNVIQEEWHGIAYSNDRKKHELDEEFDNGYITGIVDAIECLLKNHFDEGYSIQLNDDGKWVIYHKVI